MDFEVRNELVVMLQEDETAVIMAAEAVDAKDKLVVFKRKYQESYQQTPGMTHQQRVAFVLPIFNTVWKQFYEVQA